MTDFRLSPQDVSPHELSAGQKTGFVLLLVFAILVVGVGFLQMRNTIYNPFAVRTAKEVRDLNSLVDNETLLLQSTDTDGDGLYDYDELTFYETSPYLPDTDSDGINDNIEIEQGTDPLCPKGSVCETVDADIDPAQEESLIGADVQQHVVNPLDALDILSGIDTQAVGDSSQDVVPPDQQALDAFVGEDNKEATIAELQKLIQNSAELRDFLVSSGQVKPEQLAEVSDEQLVTIANQLFSQQFGNAIE
ncbi:MAG: hypothetical protein GW775_04145 [Candidatus Magasanikbacteria bacterium]|nr:hypothetical protein [Candidatus Magasanikbacteria bacterium]